MSITSLRHTLRLTSRHINRRHFALTPSFSVARASRRSFASAASDESHSRLSPVLNILLLAGIGATAYGLYDTYFKSLTWPAEVKADLKAGLKAKHDGDLKFSESFFERAWQTAKSLPPEVFGGLPYLKISGIAVALGGIYELDNDLNNAYDKYVEVLAYLQDPDRDEMLSGAERLRAVGIASKLSELAQRLKRPVGEQERWLVTAVETILKLARSQQYDIVDSDPAATVEMLTELDLPPWISKDDFGAPFEALGEFYARAGRIEYAVPLYLQAIQILIPPPPSKSSEDDVCRGAQLMNNIAELLIRQDRSEARLKEAYTWASRGLAKIQQARKSAPVRSATCEVALTAALYNNGAIVEYQGDKEKAREFFTQSLEQSKDIGMQEGVTVAQNGLKRLDAPASSGGFRSMFGRS